MEVFDYTHENDDLKIADGDFVSTESTTQHQSLLVRLKKGELRQFPKTGVGIDDFLLDDAPGDVFLEIQKQFEADGMVIRSVDIELDESNSKLKPKVNAFYP
jgi:hypothetical protein